MNSSKVLLGILGGVAAGVLVGVLFAPDKGTKTRKKILSKVKKGEDYLKDTSVSVLDSASQKYENILKVNEKLISDGEAKLSTIKKELNGL